MMAKCVFANFGAQKELNKSTGPEGFAENWVKIHLKGIALQDEVVAKFMQKLYELGKKKTK